MVILGLNAYHGDSAACIMRDGLLIAASEEERFRRIKHWAGFPSLAVNFCLKEAGVKLSDVKYVTISRDPSANFHRKVLHAVAHPGKYKLFIDRLKNSRRITSLGQEFTAQFGSDADGIETKIVNVEHHLSHIASAVFASPFKECAALSIDGFGDYSSTAFAYSSDLEINILDRVVFPHSCGMLYTAFTQLMGFKNYGDEYKVMGLAPYGKPIFYEKLKKVVTLKDKGKFELNTKYFAYDKKGSPMTWMGGAPVIDDLFSEAMVADFGPVRTKDQPLTQEHRDLAASVQKMCEEIIFNALNHLQRVTGSENISLAGGVAQNSVANGKITRRTKFKHCYLPMAGHDAGTAIGSALYHYHARLKKPRTGPNFNPYAGSRFTNDEIEVVLKAKGLKYERIDDWDSLYDVVANRMIDAGVVGWFQGRAEFGPRALGGRSILCDPSRADAKELINSKIKRRESFRPFAPSILEEYVSEYFEVVETAPFMEKVFPIRNEKRPLLPAVTHVDGTGRLQTVGKQTSPKYYGLIEAFRKKTGIPLLLNTSFNENEPIVNTPEEAIDCFLRTSMDMLVLENCVVRR